MGTVRSVHSEAHCPTVSFVYRLKPGGRCSELCSEFVGGRSDNFVIGTLNEYFGEPAKPAKIFARMESKTGRVSVLVSEVYNSSHNSSEDREFPWTAPWTS